MYYDKASGFVGINTSTPSGDLQLVQTDGLSNGTGGMIFTRSNGGSDVWKIFHSGSHFSFAKEGTRLAYVEEGTGNWVQPSSRNAKSDIAPLTSVLNKLIHLNPVSYAYHHDVKNLKHTVL